MKRVFVIDNFNFSLDKASEIWYSGDDMKGIVQIRLDKEVDEIELADIIHEVADMVEQGYQQCDLHYQDASFRIIEKD